MDEKLLAKANAIPKPEYRLAMDVQLRTAKELLASRHRPPSPSARAGKDASEKVYATGGDRGVRVKLQSD